MKSYEEMTQSVLKRAKEQRAVQKRRNRNILAAVAACVCCLTFAVFAGMRLYSPKPTDQTPGNSTAPDTASSITLAPDATPRITLAPDATPRITLLTATENFTSHQELVKDVIAPFHVKLRVRDLRGLSEENVQKARLEEQDYAVAFRAQTSANGITVRYGSETAIITLLYDGKLYLILNDYEQDYAQVQDMSVTTTSAGTANLESEPYKADDGTLQRAIKIRWMLSNATVDKIEKDPAMKLSEISDTVTVTVKFKDGSTETAVIDIMVDDEGQVYIMQRGVTVTT